MLDLFMEEFQEYRMKEAEKGAVVFRQLLNGNFSPEFVKGAAHMLKQIISLPVEMASKGTKEQKERAQVLSVEMMNAVEAKLVRRSLIEE
jgi:hypothetical protein